MTRTALNPRKSQTPQFQLQRPPLRKRILGFLKHKTASARKQSQGAAPSAAFETAASRPYEPWPDFEGVVPMTVLESTTQDHTAVESARTLRFCTIAVGVLLVLLGLIAVIIGLARHGAFPFIRVHGEESSRIPITTHTTTAEQRPREAVLNMRPDESSRGKQVATDDKEAATAGDAENEESGETQSLQTKSSQEATDDWTEQALSRAIWNTTTSM